MSGLRVLLALALLSASSLATASGPFTCYFESGSFRLTPLHEDILNHAVDWLRSNNATAIFIEASADRVGSASSNLRLSQRRGEAVRQGLIRRGFRPDQISVRAFGEERPLAETADGVPEPQNRFAMIFIDAAATPRR